MRHRFLYSLLLRRAIYGFMFALLSASTVQAAERAPILLQAKFTAPLPEQDDAALRAVTCVGKTVWAVGDRGAVWRSTDAGATWSFIALPKETHAFSLHSVCFLTDRVGWIAGGTVLPVGGVLQGVVLATNDGGQTWQVQPGQGLPYLRHIQFFDLSNGIAVGERSTDYPSGALQTTDGGLTWNPLTAKKSGTWIAASFVSADRGILGGTQGTQAAVDRSSILPAGSGSKALFAWHGASLDLQGQGWMAGDGAALVRTVNHGVSWQSVQENLPSQLDDFTNFACVLHRGTNVWVAGTPGSVIWHSPDAGTTWRPARTGDPTPLTAIQFIDDQQGIAVGQLGKICVTRDGGRNWTAVRGGQRRLACLALQTHAARTALPFLTRWSREEGYRTAVMIATRRDLGEDAHAVQQLDMRLAHAVQTAGGSRGWIDWRLPLALPLIEGDRDQLLEEWTLLTDRRLSDVLLASLVGEIRTWRPSVLLIDERRDGEYATELLQRAIEKAMSLAADPTFALNQTQIAGLAPWTVKKLVLQRKDGTAGTVRLDPFEILPRQQSTLDVATASAQGQLHQRVNGNVLHTEFLISRTQGEPAPSDRMVFGDLALGSDARREMPPIRTLDYDRLTQEINHRRTVTAASARIIADPERAGMLLGQLKEIIAPLSPEQAAQQLSVLGRMYHQRGEWSLAESVYSELIVRYPDQPPAVDAMLWLMQFWTSAEMNWQRLRTMQATRTQVRTNPLGEGINQAALETALKTVREQSTKTAAALNAPRLAATVMEDVTPFAPNMGDMQSVVTASGTSSNPQQMQLARWQAAASSVSKSLRAAYPHLFQNPEVQFVTAALYRRRGESNKADEIYGTFMKSLSDDPWNIAARGEAYLLRPGVQSPKPMIVCKQTRMPPMLDGVLSDPCWTQAAEIRLGEDASETYVGSRSAAPRAAKSNPQPVVFLAHDDRFLYLAASVPLDPTLPTDAPELPGRTHDADLAGFDRLCLQLDVDRDYATYYQFEVDQRGQTRDACWDNQAYNPTWYCAATRAQDAWRVECAIPLGELLPAERIIGTAWGVGITRLQPGRGSQSWTGSGSTSPQPALFGLMRFE
ncbi:YCF48-related protein [Planctomicrobium piriforme]|uniref:Photosynthesis system II assembly factor Ycf48/Hcf136-like domain-containing protein n=1 Tax=Planctomicrobium piriforme TaxID=1576369 RepID=A0A1I3S5N5_9PLAN|nr:YCF48-related protein [Planctomicrobium piriforme]SFJ53995.1 Uncharacterized protein SAMN05421753_12327 [Planctomicrobium piriforme]